MAGEIVGLDGIGTRRAQRQVVALEDGEVCVIQYAQLRHARGRARRRSQHQVHRMMSREIVREQGQWCCSATCAPMRASPHSCSSCRRSSRRAATPPTEFHLRMTRDEIGSYLGVTLETMSRALSRFQEQGLIRAKLRSIAIADVAAVCGGSCPQL